MSFIKLTESNSLYDHLEQMPVSDLLKNMQTEQHKVAGAIDLVLPQVETLVHAIVDRMISGGRLFYLGAGTSGRIGVLDASECPPTFGIDLGLIIGIIAGGEQALQQAVEDAEDNVGQGWLDLEKFQVNSADVVIGISASGTTPYVFHALETCKEHGILTGCICSNPGSPIATIAEIPIEVVTGPEFITGSTRLKAGTAQKMLLNLISTTVMIRLGRVTGNQMVHMQLTNEKLIDRGTRMIMEGLQITDYEKARNLLLEHRSVNKVLQFYHL